MEVWIVRVTGSRWVMLSGAEEHPSTPSGPGVVICTTFEGTSEIPRLVIARSISGLRIE